MFGSKTNIYQIFLIVIIILGVSLDILNRFVLRDNMLSEFINWTIYFRGALFPLGLIVMYKNNKKMLLYVLFFCISSIIGTWVYSQKHDVIWFLNIKFIIKYAYPIVLYYLIRFLSLKIKYFEEIVLRLMFSIFLLQATVVLLGFILKVDWLYSYGPNRFGFSPLIASINETSLFFICGLLYFYWYQFIYKDRSVGGGIFLAFFSLASVLVGTKSIYVFLFMLLGYHFLTHFRNRKQVVVTLGIMASVMVIFILLVYPFFHSVASKAGILNSISSLRYDLIHERFIPLITENWVFANYLFGGNNTWEHFVEMDLVDLFSLSGLIGICIIIFLYFRSVFRFKSKFGYFCAISFFLIANMSGHFMWSGVNALYLVMFVLLVQRDETKTYGVEQA